MMKFKMQSQQYQRSILVFFIFFVCFKYSNGQTGNGIGLYSKRYEKIDVDTILSNPRLVTNYVDCLLNKRPCPPEGKDLKRILPEALRTKCGRCWPSQKEGALKVITRLYYDYPQHYNALREKWDPTGEYHRRFEEYLRDQNFNLISNDEDRELPAPLPPSSFTTSTTTTTTTTQSPPRQEVVPTRQTIFDQTQRPIRQDLNRPQETQDVFITNRFGEDETEIDDMTMKSQPPRTPAPIPRQPQTQKTTTITATRNTFTMQQQPAQFGGTASVTVFKTQNPILNLINRLTTKFATTAEILAGMLRGNVNVQINRNSGPVVMTNDK